MGLLLTSPAWLVAVGAVRRFGWNRLVTGCVSAVVLIALVNVAHFSQGWVQFGYRFSNDFAPFALVLLALGPPVARAHRLGGRRAHRAVDRREPVGRLLGRRLRMVNRRSAGPGNGLTEDVIAGIGLAGPVVVAIVAFALAWPTLMPGVGFWDTAEFQAVPPAARDPPPDRVPRLHAPWLGRIRPAPAVGSPAYRMNVLSAVYVAGAAAVTVVLVAS